MNHISEAQLLSALSTHFGFSTFRPQQKEIVSAILSGQDTLAILPTGGGKSLCFQLPGLLLSGVTIVVSPLISLMTDQVAHLQKKGISAAALTSSLSKLELRRAVQKITEGQVKFVYVSPERLQTKLFVSTIKNLDVSLVVIDEAHCISEWGHQFRPEYRQILSLLSGLSRRPVVAAFTASATPRTAQDILDQLKLYQPYCVRQSVLRSNLSLSVFPCPTHTIQHIVLLRLLKRHADQAAIIYCATRRQTEDVAQLLNQLDYRAAAYHAGLDSSLKQQIQHDFLNNEYQLICATTAFGMGVDKPNIRCVIHLNLPASLEGYYQEVGRAGRDGGASECYLLSLPTDPSLQGEIVERSYPPIQVSRAIISYLARKKIKAQQNVSIQSIGHMLLEQKLSDGLRVTLERGKNCGWWSLELKTRIIQLLKNPNEMLQELQNLIQLQLHQLQKLKRMKSFSEVQVCRMRQLLLYFEPIEERNHYKTFQCKSCDVCQKNLSAQPRNDEQHYFQRTKKIFSKYKKMKSQPLLNELCIQLLAAHQPKNSSQLPQLNPLGRGWQKEWGFIVDKLGTADHR